MTIFKVLNITARRGAARILVSFCGLLYLMISAAVALEQYTAHGGPVKHLTLSPDGSLMVSSSFDYSAVVWSVPELADTATLLGHDAAVNVAMFTPDGDWLVTGGDDNQILLWSVADILGLGDKAVPFVLQGHYGKIVDFAFSSDGRYLVSASWDGFVGLWDMALARNRLEQIPFMFRGHDGPVNDVQFSADDKHLFSAGYDGHIRYWRVSDGEYLRSVIRNGWGVNVMLADETRNILAYGSTDGAMVLAELDTGTDILRMGEDRVPVLSVGLNLESNQIAFGNAKGQMKIVDLNSTTLLRDFRAANGPIWSVMFMPQNGDMMIASLDDFITKWQIHDFPPEILDSPGPTRRFHPAAEISNGERQFARKCSVCHTLVPDGARRAGPTLYNLFGRQAGTLPGYKYSKALLESDIIWGEETIHRLFTDGPDVVTPGTKMPIQRMKNEADRQDLIAYLKQATTPVNN